MPQGGFFVADYDAILETLGTTSTIQRGQTVLVVLILANGRSSFVRESLLPYLDYWHFRSSDAVHFFFVGYSDRARHADYRSAENVDFRDDRFVATVERLEDVSDWRYSGNASVLICRGYRAATGDAIRGELDLSRVIEFDLERAINEDVLATVPQFFEELIRFAKTQSSGNDTWTLSDVVGGKTVALALIDSVFECLPKGTKKVIRALDYFRVK